jgi:uncharacterized protein YbdZ (MbtH family)
MNPFDDEGGSFLVVANDEDQHALWPASDAAPSGWAVKHGPAERAACLEYVRANWTDIRPRTLAARVNAAE